MTKRLGFTYIELIVVGGIVVTLLGLVVFNLTGLQTRTSTGVLATQLEADLRGQQLTAMNTAAGGADMAAGIYFEMDKYVLFNGPAYTVGAADNFEVLIPSPWELVNTFDDSQAIFLPGSGEVAGLDTGQLQVAIFRTDSGDTKTIYLNKYGAYDED